VKERTNVVVDLSAAQKLCPFCCRSIEASSAKCPWCHGWLPDPVQQSVPEIFLG